MAKKQSKSPFILIEDFIESSQCEDIVLSLKNTIPNRDIKNNPLRTIKSNQLAEIRLMPKVDEILDIAEPYYGFETLNISPFLFEWMAEGYKGESPKPDNAIQLNGKWLKSKDIDFTILIFLSTTKENNLTDSLLESFGGKVEFFNHGLTITPKAGTILMFPANEYFLNNYTEVALGNLNVVRVHITSKVPYKYSPDNFPGDYRTWFN